MKLAQFYLQCASAMGILFGAQCGSVRKISSTLSSCLNARVELSNIVDILPSNTLLECGTLCAGNKLCKAANYRKSQRECIMADDLFVIANQLCNITTQDADYDALYMLTRDVSSCEDSTNTTAKANPMTTAAPTLAADPAGSCPSSYVYDINTGICYRISKTQSTFTGSELLCAADGGHLLRVINHDVWNRITAALTTEEYYSMKSFYIDGSEKGRVGVWKYSDNTAAWTLWAPEDPGSADENCMAMYRPYNLKFMDVNCLMACFFICQID